MKAIILLITLILSSCASTHPKIDVVWPKPPLADQILIIIASDTAYVPASEFYRIGLNQTKTRKLFFGDCIYFYIDTISTKINYQFFGMSNDFPTSHFKLNNLELGRTYYFERDLVVSRDPNNKVFIKSGLDETLSICNKYGFDGQRFEVINWS